MRRSECILAGIFAIACAHLLVPATLAVGKETRIACPTPSINSVSERQRPSYKPPVSDVSLSVGGRLEGAVVDVQGIPIAEAPVVVRHEGQEIARTTSDAAGRFRFRGLRGGVHQIVAAHGSGLYRLWTPRTAPPSSENGVLIITKGDVLRCQFPLRGFLTSDKVLFGGVVLGAVAIPIVVYNNRGSGS